jgi:uncharacterized Tic20 family protein
MAAHISSLLGLVCPFGHLLGPFLCLIFKGRDDPYIEAQAKESLNFQLSMTIYMIISGLLIFVIIGILLLPLVALANIILVIIAAVKANNGEPYHYPFTFRFLQ